jgi:ribonuclease HI
MTLDRLTHGITKLLHNLKDGMTLSTAIKADGSITEAEAKTALDWLAKGISTGLIPISLTSKRQYLVYTDGAAKGNPGPAGAGVVVKDMSGNVLIEKAEPLGKTTNNVAEYMALIIALETMLELEAESFIVHTDSELMFKQMTGQYKIQHPNIKPLAAEAFRILKEIGIQRWKIMHIPREENEEADKLSNLGVSKNS